jgi:hypothetical protein
MGNFARGDGGTVGQQRKWDRCAMTNELRRLDKPDEPYELKRLEEHRDLSPFVEGYGAGWMGEI